jgi:hypothetical protein
VIELSISDADVAKLMSIARSRTEPASPEDAFKHLICQLESFSSFWARDLGLEIAVYAHRLDFGPVLFDLGHRGFNPP